MNIRRAQSSDIPLIAAVQTESWQDAYSDVLPEAYLAGQISEDLILHWSAVQIQAEDVVLVAEDGGIIGFIAIWCRPDPFIDNLHVKPCRRSKRVGSTLLKSAAQLLIQQGHRTAYLWVVASNSRAIQLYERLGGVCTDRALKNLYGHDVLNIKIEWQGFNCSIYGLIGPGDTDFGHGLVYDWLERLVDMGGSIILEVLRGGIVRAIQYFSRVTE